MRRTILPTTRRRSGCRDAGSLQDNRYHRPVLALSHQTGVTLAEVGFLLILFAGVWLVAAQIPAFKMPTARTIVAGIALALAGVLLIIATHWGHFG